MTEAATQHILLHVTAEGKVFAAGTENIVKAIVGEIELYQKIKTCINYRVSQNIGYPQSCVDLDIFKGFCSILFMEA